MADQPNRKLGFLAALIAVLTAASLMVILFVFKPEAKLEDLTGKTTLVEVITAKPENATLTIPSQGLVEPRTETNANAEVSGKVIEVSEKFEAGHFFEPDEVLLKIDPSDYEAALAKAEAALADARLMLATEQARADQASRDWDKLARRQEASALTLREPHIASAEAGVHSAMAGVEKARRDLERTELRALYAGRVRRTYTDLGSYVTTGAHLADLYDTSIYEIRLPVSLNDYADADPAPGKEVKLAIDAGGETFRWTAKIARTEGELDRESRSAFIIAEIRNDEMETSSAPVLAPGLFVRATIPGKTLENVYRIPRKALLEGNRVLVVDDDDKLRFAPVTVRRLDGTDMLISHGINAGDRVCLTQLDSPISGMPVQVAPTESLPQTPPEAPAETTVAQP